MSSKENKTDGAPQKRYNVQHDPFREIKMQQDVLNQAIEQHPNEPEIQDALRRQKAALGAHAVALKRERETLKNIHDGGGAYYSNLHHHGTLGQFLAHGDAKIAETKRNLGALAGKSTEKKPDAPTD
jgi:hypothetical protein